MNIHMFNEGKSRGNVSQIYIEDALSKYGVLKNQLNKYNKCSLLLNSYNSNLSLKNYNVFVYL